MKLLKSIFAFYINSSIHVGLAVLAFALVTKMEFNLQGPNALYGFIFLGTITAYNFMKYAKITGLHHRSLAQSLKSIQVFSFVCFLLLVYFTYQLSIVTILATASFAMLTFLYGVPIIFKKSLRNVPVIKIFIVAIVWAGITVVIPFISADHNIGQDEWITIIQRIFIVIALTVPFEIRDIQHDALRLKTLPQIFGIRNARLGGISLLILCLVIEMAKDNSSSAYIFSVIFLCLVTGWLLLNTKTNQTRYFSSFWVESMPILWCILLWILNAFYFI